MSDFWDDVMYGTEDWDCDGDVDVWDAIESDEFDRRQREENERKKSWYNNNDEDDEFGDVDDSREDDLEECEDCDDNDYEDGYNDGLEGEKDEYELEFESDAYKEGYQEALSEKEENDYENGYNDGLEGEKDEYELEFESDAYKEGYQEALSEKEDTYNEDYSDEEDVEYDDIDEEQDEDSDYELDEDETEYEENIYSVDSDKTTKSFNFKNQVRTQFDRKSILKYFDYGWSYFPALYDHFAEVRKDYDRDMSISVSNFLTDIAEYDIDKSLFYWKWLMDYFTPSILKEKDNNFTVSDIRNQPASNVLYFLSTRDNEENNKKVIELLKEEKYFNYIFKEMPWEEHEEFKLYRILMQIYRHSGIELLKKCYEAYLKYQTSSYCNRDLVAMWKFFLGDYKVLHFDDNLLDYATREMNRLGNCGKPVLMRIEDIKEENKKEEEKTKRYSIDKNNLLRYYDYGWNYFEALYDNFEDIRKDYNRDANLKLKEFLGDIAEYDVDKAIIYWKWVMKTFSKEILLLAFDDDEDVELCEAGSDVLSYLCETRNEEKEQEIEQKIVELLKEEYYFNYIFKELRWDKYHIYAISKTIKMAYEYAGSDLTKKCYFVYKEYQKNNYSKSDLASIWKEFLNSNIVLNSDILGFIKEELKELGNCGISALKEIEKQEELKALEQKAFCLAEKIKAGEFYDENYKLENKTFDFCFLSTKKTYDTVANIVLSKYSQVKDFNLDHKIGQIHSNNIEEITMIAVTTYKFSNHIYNIYSNKKDYNYDEDIFNKNYEICEFIRKYSYLGQMMELEKQADKLSVPYYKKEIFNEYFRAYKRLENMLNDKAKEIFNNACKSGKVKISWIEEKELYSYISAMHKDAIYKYKPEWGEGLLFDVYIPSHNLVIEYKESLPINATNYDLERYEDAMKKFEKKQFLCKQQGVRFIEWDSSKELNEINVLSLIK